MLCGGIPIPNPPLSSSSPFQPLAMDTVLAIFAPPILSSSRSCNLSFAIPISLPKPLPFATSSLPRLHSPPSRNLGPFRAQVSVSAAQKTKDRLPAGLIVTETKGPQSTIRLSVEVPPAISQECYGEVLDEFSKKAKVPGFRQGKKVPENILLNYIGRQNIQQAIVEATLKKTLPHAMSSVEGRALKDSVRIVTKFSDMLDAFSLQDHLRYDIVADVSPEIKWLDKYKNLKIVVEIDNVVKAESASERELNRRYKALGSLRIVTDRGLQIGDLVVLDIFAKTVGQNECEGEKIPSAERKGFYLDTEERHNLLAGFLDSILGIQQGQTRTFPLQFPETWDQDNLRGVHAQFTVECKELFYRVLPELDDTLAEKLLPGCSSLNQVREAILQRCKQVEQTAIEQATDNAILDQLNKIIEVDIPRSLLEEQGRHLYGAKLLQLQVDNKINESQLASLTSERAVKQFIKKEEENISKIIKQMLAVSEIFKCEKLQYTTDELVKEVENSIAEFKRNNQEYEEEHVREQVEDVLEGAKVLEWLRENVDIQYVYK
ncbi:trigger factor-like protein TIG, Chloroplastic isoform X1 [Zingiber officinale]|uniref:trigger factor-like protein TIG, Chloroplastic isoform X1 n=1 Tax=Zingiber officinale TaxID=94328 RepID=UPI001C4BAD1C|nr:trigger factor-like protein TIG, Chloroplastic isoform X1 [Zingiber officinale]